MIKQIDESLAYIRSKTDSQPVVGIILGSGLSNLSNEIDTEVSIPYAEIPHFPEASVKGHKANLIVGTLNGTPVVAMGGRYHYYEGHSMQAVTFPVRVMKAMGIQTLIVSNASGGVNPNFEVGDIMVITDHINMQPDNPLRGPNDERLGPRFPDMLETYKEELVDHAQQIAHDLKIKIHKGVYVGVAGPNFETPAEYRFFHIIGGDAVGMSTVPEVIVARHAGLDVFAISIIADIGYPPDAISEVSHDIVLEKAAASEPKVTQIIKELIRRLA